MDTHDFDVVVIGAGIAGSTCASALAADRRVALIEAEEFAGYHSTGRSAALWLRNYGPPDVRALTASSRPFFEHPSAGFAEVPLMSQRTVTFLARADQRAELDALLAEGSGLREAPVGEVTAMAPALRPGYATWAAIEVDAFDIDVAALHHGFLRQLRARGGTLALHHRAARIERHDGRWSITTARDAMFRAPVVVNAAGAWGDDVAALAGLAPLGLSPCRRTVAIIEPSPHDVSRWPMLIDVGTGGTRVPRHARGCWYRPPTRPRRTLTTCSPTSSTSPLASTACSRRWISRCGGWSEPGPGCGHSRRTAAWHSAGTARPRASSGVWARVATASRPRRRRESWWPT